MNAPDRLARLRAELEGFDGCELVLSYIGSTACIERVDRNTGEAVMLAEFTDAGSDEQTFLVGALDNIRFLIGQIDAGKRPNYAAQAAMLCDDARFRAFLNECAGIPGPPVNKASAPGVLRDILGIKSRARLNDNPKAAANWQKLFSRFEAWKLV